MNGNGDLVGLDGFLDTLKQLVRQPAVVGAEQAFFRVLRRELEEAGARVTLFDGLLVAEGSRPDVARFCAHVDRHGLVCTGPNEFQYAAFVPHNRGDLQGNSVSEQTYQKLAGRFHGKLVQAYEPWSGGYLGQGTIEHSYVCERRGNLVFELKGLDHLLPGTPVAYLDRLVVADDLLSAQLDNVLSATILVHAFRAGFAGTAFFTAGEEVGRSWRYLLEWFRRFDRASQELFVLDTSPFPDRDTAERQEIVLRHRDVHAPFAERAVGRLVDLCTARGISYSFKDEYLAAQNAIRTAAGLPPTSLGSTELGRLTVASGGDVRGATLQIPTTGYHTPEETTTLGSVQCVLDLVLALGT
jgi:putative aminopeptidase FrvX